MSGSQSQGQSPAAWSSCHAASVIIELMAQQCDEKKPICSRCSKTSLDCRYRDQADLLFRNQTASAAQRAEDSWRKRSKSNQREPASSGSSNASPPGDESSPPGTQQLISGALHSQQAPTLAHIDEHMDASDGAALVPDLGNLTMTPSDAPDLCHLAFQRFVYDFVSPEYPGRPSNEPPDDLWTFIPTLYQNAPEGSCLVIILNAVACVNYANRCNAPYAMAAAEEYMAKGIAMLTKVLAEKTLAASDEVLCSVYLMAVYEVLQHQCCQGNG